MTDTRDPNFEVDFAADDPDDPRNWPLWYRSLTIAVVSFATWVVVLSSTCYTSSLPGMMDEFHITSETTATLGLTTYLIGLACGSFVLAPLSEVYGRRPVYVGSMLVFCLLVLPCALATGLTEILVVRFFEYTGPLRFYSRALMLLIVHVLGQPCWQMPLGQ